MAVYGIGENKCLKEVLTKDDFLHDHVAGVWVSAESMHTMTRNADQLKTLYPQLADWAPDKWCVVGLTCVNLGNSAESPSKGTWTTPCWVDMPEISDSGMIMPEVELTPSGYRVTMYNDLSTSARMGYHLVLMRRW